MLKFEMEVVKYFAELWHMKEEPWGYVASGSSEAILYGFWSAR
jgi:glutamate/tyrosine decarboxylase-like PLP-dependent enzyme